MVGATVGVAVARCVGVTVGVVVGVAVGVAVGVGLGDGDGVCPTSVGHFLRTVHTCYPFLFSAPAFALV